MYGSTACPAAYANSSMGFDGLESYVDGQYPDFIGKELAEDPSYIENSRMVFRKIANHNMEQGFSSAEQFFQWLDCCPVYLQLCRGCKKNEEILFYYNFNYNTNDLLRVPQPAMPNLTQHEALEEDGNLEMKDTAPPEDEVEIQQIPDKSPASSTPPAQSKSTGGISHSATAAAVSRPQARLFAPPSTRASSKASASPSGSPAEAVKQRRSQQTQKALSQEPPQKKTKTQRTRINLQMIEEYLDVENETRSPEGNNSDVDF